MSIELMSVVRAGVHGALVGDALGVPYEFHDASEIPHEVEMSPPDDFHRAHAGVPVGTWSDDGAQLLALMESIAEGPRSAWSETVDLLSRRLVRWYRDGAFTPDGVVFDIGITTFRAIEQLEAGDSPLRSGPSHERSNGNGSLMRVLPVALAAYIASGGAPTTADYDHACALACAQSLPTHGHPLSLLCCAVYVTWAIRLCVEARPSTSSSIADSFADAVSGVRAWTEGGGHSPFMNGEDAARALARIEDGVQPSGSGFVLDSLWTARDCLVSTASYEDAVVRAVRYGDDTDTSACITGGLAGIIYGNRGIPERWLQALRGSEKVRAALAAFCTSCAG